MYIHKEGFTTIPISLLIVGLIVAIGTYFLPTSFAMIFWVLGVIMTYLVIQFFRNPKRVINDSDVNHVYCPADGKVVVIEEVEEPEFFKDKRIQVSIFMSPLNVHSNKAAIPGKIRYSKYHDGKYLVAWHPKSSTENERSTIVIDNGQQQVLLRQIAGAVARRIKTYVKVGDTVKHGQEYGFIKFGSRVDIFLPIGTEITVKHDQKVKANIDLLAKL